MARIAYIDDDQDCLDIIRVAFEDLGIKIDTYDDPVQFYSQGKEYPLIISDFKMPYIDGQEFIKILKEKFPKTKMVIYSGSIDEIKELDLGIDNFLSKPLEFNSLLKTAKFLLYAYDKEESIAAVS